MVDFFDEIDVIHLWIKCEKIAEANGCVLGFDESGQAFYLHIPEETVLYTNSLRMIAKRLQKLPIQCGYPAVGECL